jgi:hypothetical protein
MATVLHEGTEEWADRIKEKAVEHLIALHDLLSAHLFINRLVEGWDTLDAVIQAALFRSAVTIYARPFVKNKRKSKKNFRFPISSVLKTVPDFDPDLHDHICRLRQTLIAHHDTSVVNAQIGHTRIKPEEFSRELTVQTYGMSRALHAIAKREIAERYLKHIVACKAYFLQATHDALGELHMLRVTYPDLGMAKMKSVSVALEQLGERKFRLPDIEAISRLKPIDTPHFIISSDSYIWLTFTQLFETINTRYTTADGKMVEVIGELDGQPDFPSHPDPIGTGFG